MAGSDEVSSTVALRIDSSFSKTSVIRFGVSLGRGNNVGSWGHAIVTSVLAFCLSPAFSAVVCASTYQTKTAAIVMATRFDSKVNNFQSLRPLKGSFSPENVV